MTAWPELKEKLLSPVTNIEWDTRTVNCLTKEGIIFIGQVYLRNSGHLRRIPNFGKNSFGHLEKYLEINGLLPIPTESSEIPWENYSSFISSEMAPFGLNWKSESKEVKKYYQSEHFAQMQVAFEKFLEKYKEYFQLAADPQGHFEINREKEAEACESQRQAAQYPSTYDWILQNLPSEMRDSLSEEFLSAVLNSAEVREGVQKVVSQIVIEKLGLNAK